MEKEEWEGEGAGKEGGAGGNREELHRELNEEEEEEEKEEEEWKIFHNKIKSFQPHGIAFSRPQKVFLHPM